MLAAQQRIRTSRDFSQVISGGVKVVQPGAIIYLYHQKNIDKAAGFIVSKAIGNAVVRNLVKRRFRAIVHHQLPDNTRLVIRARPHATKFTFEQLQEQYLEALEIAMKKMEAKL